MRAYTRALWLLSVGSLSLLAVGCVAPSDQALDDQNPHQPGDALGSYSVTGKLSDDSCGADSLNAPTRWTFDVKLSKLGDTLYWLNGREAIVGDIDSSGSFAFTTHVDVTLSEQRGAAKGCTLVRSDSASGKLTDSNDTLSGKLSYAYSARADSECDAYAIGTDGLPLALPCKLTYSLDGARVDAN
ncbi:MAG TPA: hypothetical protein VER04_26655 [Polyangiaceae bacterium]|nr:hypothetical protein [Polyangiaceae bacterium]